MTQATASTVPRAEKAAAAPARPGVARARSRTAREPPYAYIRRFYGVDPKVGQRIAHYGRPGKIIRPVGDPHYLRVRFDGRRHASNVHPTDEVDYSPAVPCITPAS